MKKKSMKKKNMQKNKPYSILFIVFAVLVALSIYFLNRSNSPVPQSSDQTSKENPRPASTIHKAPQNQAPQKLASNDLVVRVYRTPYCGCCQQWVQYLKDSGFHIDDRIVQDLDAVNQELGVPQAFESCHAGWIQGYFLEGHIPAEDILRLISEKPSIQGIAVPGMPIGSPGMEQGSKKDPYVVWAFDGKDSYPFSSYNQKDPK